MEATKLIPGGAQRSCHPERSAGSQPIYIQDLAVLIEIFFTGHCALITGNGPQRPSFSGTTDISTLEGYSAER